MKYLLILLLPCLAWAGDYKVHRAPVNAVCTTLVDNYGRISRDCQQLSHYIDTCAFTVTEKCYAVYGDHELEWRMGKIYIVTPITVTNCHPDTIWERLVTFSPLPVPRGARIDSAIIEVLNRPEWKDAEDITPYLLSLFPREFVLKIAVKDLIASDSTLYQQFPDSTELRILRQMIEWFKHKDEPKVRNLPGYIIDSLNCDLLDRSLTK